ncbi:WASH complex subunit 3-like [Xenia sp. Carnegie-2017]|uniref:WASH complex subunit 3-like n=1 Tax=Xenia sp. Carnegie-2017 TaxID=2897299 RepID=UPI001F03C850|nr:WASH complex subunit 3-like [Xenia sp. Carnegie-2017]XP_046844737.1 WASH complex subunit 3-like [Xenia sp. Carnegie-2017]XP_046844738.1 WASH complex subunit 3-like [Xenia sp. Carnegie-2017]XP_046844739.1 WASH complex subunit 3-like [Xenia sp. Carnegie-2017]
MDSDGLPIMGPAIDLTKVGSIQQKRIVAFINHFVAHTVNFLNRFSCVCEEKLSDLSNRLQRVDVTMSILEAKLSSIPGLENVTAPESSTPTADDTSEHVVPESTASPAQPTASPAQPTASDSNNTPSVSEELSPPVEEEPAQPVMTVSKDPRYAKFFQMLKVGVPLAALRPKILSEGLDPDLLQTPDAPAPGGQISTNTDDDDDDSSSASSFSDD